MKKFILISAVMLSVLSFDKLNAQQVNININIGSQPAWGPAGYDYARYYYLPDIDCYYDVNMALFYFMDRGRWVSARYLPHAYHHFDLYRTYKVVINGHHPWRYHNSHYKAYAKYRGKHNQAVIYRSNDRRYAQSRNNRVDWVAPEYRANDNSRNNRKPDKAAVNKNTNTGRSTPQTKGNAGYGSASNDKNKSSVRKEGRQTSSQRQYAENARTSRR